MPAPEAGGSGTERLSFHELLTRFSPQYLERFGSAMPARQRQVLERILACRTPALGGELFGCPDCAQFRYRYHSCNDRHCPLCGTTDADHWLEQRRQRLLLPVPYFLVTFTVPDPLRSWIRSHPKVGYDILFDASAQALQDLADNPKRLGAQLGLLGILHTWSRTLIFHPHVHYLVPGRRLESGPDASGWPAFPSFSFQKRLWPLTFALSSANTSSNALRKLWANYRPRSGNSNWGVDCAAAGSGENALAYLARYIFKTATGNRRLQILPSGEVIWPYRDSNTGQHTAIPLEPTELVRRFLQHVLPKGFCRVRLFGWLHPAGKIRGNRVRALLEQAPVLTPPERANLAATQRTSG